MYCYIRSLHADGERDLSQDHHDRDARSCECQSNRILHGRLFYRDPTNHALVLALAHVHRMAGILERQAWDSGLYLLLKVQAGQHSLASCPGQSVRDVLPLLIPISYACESFPLRLFDQGLA